MTIWLMRIACWIHKATNTHSEYVITIAFPLQQWLHESATTLGCTYSTVTVLFSCNFILIAFCISMKALALTEFITVTSTGTDRMY